MWDLENKTPFAAERVVLQDTDGADVWIVAVRGTFTLQLGGSVELAEEQQPVCLIPEYTGEAGRSSLRCDDDLVLTKVTTDVLLHGHAFTPEGRPADQVRVRLCVGTVDKTLLVVGDCVFKGGAGEVEPGPPQPFVKMPMVYERAWGGAEEGDWGLEGIPANPIGVGFGDPGRLEGTRAPNVLYPDRGDTRPAGFGPIPRECSPRREYAGTYDENWRRRRQPLLALDLDRRFFQCAPEDQQPPTFLQGGSRWSCTTSLREGCCGFPCRAPRSRSAPTSTATPWSTKATCTPCSWSRTG